MNTVVIPLIYVLAFLAVVLLVQTAAGLIFEASDRTGRVNRRLTMLNAGKSRDEVYTALVRRGTPGAFGGDQRLLWLWQRFALLCRQAGLTVTPERVLLITAATAAGLWLLGLFMSRSQTILGFLGNGLISLVAAVVLAGLGAWLWLGQLRARRLRKIEAQLPTALDIVSRALRAGHPVMSAIHLAADELGDPLGTEFGLVVDETTYGVEFDTALANFAERTGSGDAHFFAVSINIQSETGGNLAEILQGLSAVIRGRRSLSMRVKSLSSEGRTSALVISVLPLLMIGFQLLIHPTVYSDKFGDPIFWPVVLITALIYAVGWLIVHRIVNFRY
jgi:tight adherence protein B